MSFNVEITISCDICGQGRGRSDHRKGGAKRTMWRLEMEVEQDGWVKVNRGMGHTEAHYCPNCIDRPARSIPRPKVKKWLVPPIGMNGADLLDGAEE